MTCIAVFRDNLVFKLCQFKYCENGVVVWLIFDAYMLLLYAAASCPQNCKTCVALSNGATRCDDCIDNYQLMSTTSDVNGVAVAGKCYSTF